MPQGDERELQIEAPPEYVFAIAEWLSDERELRGRVRPVRQVPSQGEMGTAVDVLTVALGSGGVGVALVRSLCTWLTQRRADVTVKLKSPDGREVTVDVRRARDPDAVLREAAALIRSLADGD
jgi:Effector Associated Constant Component 1